MDAPAPQPEEKVFTLDALIGKLRDGETLTAAEVRHLRAGLEARAVELGKVIGRAGGMDAKTAKAQAKKLAAEVRQLGQAAGAEDG